MKSVPLLFASLMFINGAAHAQVEARPDFELNWTVPSSCPNDAAVRAQVAKLVPSPAARDQPLRVDGVVHHEPGAFVLDVVLRDGEFEGRRRFESESCAEVVGAAAVTIALLLSSGAADASEDPRDAGVADGVADQGSQSDAATPTKLAEARRSPRAQQQPARSGAQAPPPADGGWRLVLAAPSLSLGFGLLPDVSVGLGGGLGVEVESWRLLASGVWNFDAGVRLAGASDQGADIGRGTLRLAACHWFGSGRWQLAPCVTLALTYLVAHGVGSGVVTEEANSSWLAAGPGLVAGLGLTERVRPTAIVGLELQTARPVLVIEGLGEVEQIGALELFTLVGAEWIF